MAVDAADEAPPVASGRRRIGCWAALAVLALIALGLAVAWFSRETIAGNVIGRELASRYIHATYKIEQIGPRTQIVRDIVVGDPKHPDLTVERAIVRIRPRLGYPIVSRVTLIRPQLFGTYRSGKLSFGELDPLIFERRVPATAFKFPDLNLAIEDGRALVETDGGPIGAKVTGAGNLRNGFKGELAAISPRLAIAGCEVARPTLYGRIDIADRHPHVVGPMRFDRLACPGNGVLLHGGGLQLDVKADEQLARFDGKAGLRLGSSAFPLGLLIAADGNADFTWRDRGLTAKFALEGRGFASAQLGMTRLGLEGTLRARRQFERIEVDGQVTGAGVRPGGGLDASLAGAARSTRGILLGPIVEQIRRALAREGLGSSLAGEFTLRRAGDQTTLVVPSASLRGGGGATLVSLSRFQLAGRPGAAFDYSGNFATGGPGLPQVVGSMARKPGGGVQARLAMAEYRAGGSRLAIPEMVVVQRPRGALGFAGTIRASGALPGGRADNLLLPVSGTWASGELTLWRECTVARFDRLRYANLTLARQSLTLCPSHGTPIVRYDQRGLRIVAGAPSLNLSGMLGQTPIAIRSGAVGFAYPGTLSAKQLNVALGPPATAQRFMISDLTARIGKDIQGRFSGTDAKLFSVPIDILGASGDWRYANGRLTLSNGTFQVVDRQADARFKPLVAQGGTLTLENNQITAHAVLHEPRGNREVTDVTLRHDLTIGRGHADLAVRGLTFGPGFQPTDLTDRARGVVDLVSGTVRGNGQIDWGERGVTSTGRFSSNALDFAAVFGPVKGASGTVEFTDLLGLTTAPNQRIKVATINPGIEVDDGELVFELRGGQVLAVKGATWPFMGGTLTLRPVTLNLGAHEERRYVLEVAGLDAARFVERMHLENISATGIFDGTLPLVFDVDGNGRIEGGHLLSRPPGGNIAYVGALTYKDLGTMANYAFDALKSLDYQQMSVDMNGNLAGEIVTHVNFEGVKQGAGAKQNIITRQVAKLPIRFVINIRAAFRDLLTNLRSLYDPTMVKDPRELGLIDARGNVIQRESNGPPTPPVTSQDLTPNQPIIQRRESENTP
jgi:hypothetical protein